MASARIGWTRWSARCAPSSRQKECPQKKFIVLHDPEAEKSLVILFFDTEDDYSRGDEMLNAMPADETPGHRTSVTRYNVAIREKM